MARTSGKRERIMDIAQDAILAKGFDATSIEEIVAEADITKGGFFYHFKDKSALAAALLERYIAAEDALLDDLERRAAELSDDPLQRALIALKLMAETMEDLPGSHPGCLVATAAYQDRLFDARVRELITGSFLSWRARYMAMIDEIIAVYPPRDPVDVEALADMVTGVVEGGLIIQRAIGDPKAVAKQILLLRSYIKLLFTPRMH